MSEFEHWLPSEEKIEAFLRGEGDLEFRSLLDIDLDNARIQKREMDGKEGQFMVISGAATTADVDDNGVEIVPDALKSLPADFKRRNTLLFNHNPDFPIGRIGPAKFRPKTKPSARVDVEALVDVQSILPSGVRVVDAIERGTLSKFSFAWATRDGIIVFGPSKGPSDDEIEELGMDPDEAFGFRVGLDNAPKIRILSLTGTELSVVSVPADAGAGFGFQRSLTNVLSKYKRSGGGILIPESFEADEDGRILVPVKDFKAVESTEETPVVEEDEETSVQRDNETEEATEDMSDILTLEFELDMEAITRQVTELVVEQAAEMISRAVETRGLTKYKETPAIDRPWDKDAAQSRVTDWARGEDDELNLDNPDHKARYEQAFLGHVGDGTAQKDYFGLHHDVVDGELVSNFRGLADVASRLDQYESAAQHLVNEYRETHDKEPPEDLLGVVSESTSDDEDDN